MTKNEVIALCGKVRDYPFAVLLVDDYPACSLVYIVYEEYMQQMSRPYSTWKYGMCPAWYMDELSELCEVRWRIKAHEAYQAIEAWESTHKGKIPKWARPRSWF